MAKNVQKLGIVAVTAVIIGVFYVISDHDRGQASDNADADALHEGVLRERAESSASLPLGPIQDSVYEVVEQMPRFPGGDAALSQYISSHVNYPAVAEENGIQGRVVCTFIIEKDGSISDVRVIRSVDPSLDREAQRVIKAMPRWIPGRQNGETVRVKFATPVSFSLQ
ncbi:MAG: energy transducer TonB [Prevotella sp.]|nr:energy transducer TonB [Prevotella sp.]